MKKTILLSVFLWCSFLFNETTAQARVNINIGAQPVWGPVGYDYVDYYYLPDAEVYYSVPQRVYIYEERGTWVRAASLPTRFGAIDLYHVYKVVINEPKPYLHHITYKVKYVQYKGNRNQVVIRDSHEEKYFVIKSHPEHSKWKGQSNAGGKTVQHSQQRREPTGKQSSAPQKKAGQQKGGGKHKR